MKFFTQAVCWEYLKQTDQIKQAYTSSKTLYLSSKIKKKTKQCQNWSLINVKGI